MALLEENCLGGSCEKFYQTYSFTENKILFESESASSPLRSAAISLNRRFYAVVKQTPGTLGFSSMEFHSMATCLNNQMKNGGPSGPEAGTILKCLMILTHARVLFYQNSQDNS